MKSKKLIMRKASESTSVSRITTGGRTGICRLMHHAVVVMGILVVMVCISQADAPGYKVDPGTTKDGKATGDATITIEIDWSKGSGKHKKNQKPLKTEISIKKGWTEQQVAQAIYDGATQGNGDFARAVRSNFDVGKPTEDKGHNWTLNFTPKDPQTAISGMSVSGNSAELSMDGVVMGTSKTLNGQVRIAGTGKANDNLQIYLWDPVLSETTPLVFKLDSYDGLTGAKIEEQLAVEIEQEWPGFNATVKNGALVISGVSADSLGIGYSLNPGSGLQVTAGAYNAPEPSSLLLVGSSMLGVAAFLRRRILKT